MKKIAILSLLLVSQLSFAGEVILSKEDGENVITAIDVALENTNIKCEETDPLELDELRTVKLSKEELEIVTTTVSTTEDLSQPVITIKWMFGTDKNRRFEKVYKYTTDANFVEISEVEIVWNSVSETKINTGTLIKPVIVTRDKRIQVHKLICK